MAAFKDAFRSAREKGLSSFTWNGQKYSTELAKQPKSVPVPTRAPRAQAKPQTSSTRSVMDVAESRKGLNTSKSMTKVMRDKGWASHPQQMAKKK